MKTKIDLHSHSRGSDGTGSPEEIAEAAKAAGLDGLVISDHHTSETAEAHRVADALRSVGVLPIIAAEYSTAQGHLLVYGVPVPSLRWGMYPEMQAVIDEVNGLGGVCIVPHVWKGYQRALREKVEMIKGLVALESLNGQVEFRDPDVNRRARRSAQKMKIPRVAGSDAHFVRDIGVAYTEFAGPVTNEAEFLAALRSGKYRAMRNERIFKRNTEARNAKAAWQRESTKNLVAPPPPRQGFLWKDWE